jgi:hypothetical protein
MAWVQTLINKIISWIDHLFNWGDQYTPAYSKLLVYGLLIFLTSKVLKVKWNLNTGSK